MKKKDKNVLGISRLNDPHRRGVEAHNGQPEAATPPQTLTEIELAVAWQSAKPGIPTFRETNFVAAGGDSLSLAQVIAEVETSRDIRLTVEEVAKNLTLQDMAALIDRMVARTSNKR